MNPLTVCLSVCVIAVLTWVYVCLSQCLSVSLPVFVCIFEWMNEWMNTCIYIAPVKQKSSESLCLCHEAVTQFEDSRIEALEHKRAVRKGFNLAATSALGHVTVAVASAAPELDSTPINKLTTRDPSFSMAQSVPLCLSLCLSVCLFECVSVCLSVCVSVHMSVCLCVCSANDGCLYVYDRERNERTLKVCSFVYILSHDISSYKHSAFMSTSLTLV